MRETNEPLDQGPEEGTEEVETIGQYMTTPEEFIARYTHCTICGSHLHFTHITDFGLNQTQESARCPECGLRAHKSVHALQ